MNLLIALNTTADINLTDIAEAMAREGAGEMIAELLIRVVYAAEEIQCQSPDELAKDVAEAFRKRRGKHAECALSFLKALREGVQP